MQSPPACNEFDSSVVLRLIPLRTGRYPVRNTFVTVGTGTGQAIENDVSNCHAFVSAVSSFLSAVQRVAFPLRQRKQWQRVWSHLVILEVLPEAASEPASCALPPDQRLEFPPTQGRVIDSRGTATTLTECLGNPFFYGPYTCRHEQ